MSSCIYNYDSYEQKYYKQHADKYKHAMAELVLRCKEKHINFQRFFRATPLVNIRAHINFQRVMKEFHNNGCYVCWDFYSYCGCGACINCSQGGCPDLTDPDRCCNICFEKIRNSTKGWAS